MKPEEKLAKLLPSAEVRLSGTHVKSSLDLNFSALERTEKSNSFSAFLAQPELDDVQHVSISHPLHLDGDLTPECRAVIERGFPKLTSLFVHSKTLQIGSDLFRGGSELWLSTWCGKTVASGEVVGVGHLEVRDECVSWEQPAWRGLRSLSLRPFGWDSAWIPALLESAESLPDLVEVSVSGPHTENIVNALIDSKIMGRVRRLNLSGSVTNRVAETLIANSEKLISVNELLVGVDPRARAEGRGADDGWNARLRHCFKARASFRLPSGYPNLRPETSEIRRN